MLEIILAIGILGFLGYFAFKIFIKHETPLEAMTEIKDEIVHEAKHIEEVVEHQIDDTLHSLEDNMAAKTKAAEEEKKRYDALWNSGGNKGTKSEP
mgnify:CR=1 FL=1